MVNGASVCGSPMKIQLISGELTAAAVQSLLTAGGALDLKSEPPKPHEWMPDSMWLNCLALARAVPGPSCFALGAVFGAVER